MIAAVSSLIEDGDSLDSTRLKSIFYSLYFGVDSPSLVDHLQYVDCFVMYEERTRTVRNEDGTGGEESYTVAIPIQDLKVVYVFCGCCGGRLVLTTNGKVVTLASGEKKGVKRIRYVCYNKTRKRSDCDGQTGYTMHILDSAVTQVVNAKFI